MKLVWAAIVVAIWLVLVACAYWEPVVHDGWAAVTWLGDHPPTAETVWVFFRDSYNGSNPRLGQTFTILMYEPGPWHVIVTPLAELALFYLLTVLALGRWPRRDDALAFATVTAIVVVCTPEIGQMLFYRPYVGNYTMGLLLNVAWLVPYRLHVERARVARLWWAPALFALGVAAGLCNEHTGPAFVGAAALAVYASRRRGDRIAAWMIAGIVGLVAGYIALLAAPGQAYRYAGLATKQSTLELVAERGVAGNLAIVGWLVFFVAHAAPWIGVGVVVRGPSPPSRSSERPARPHPLGAVWLALAGAGAVATLTLLASPKVGERLYLASTVLIGTAIAGWLLDRIAAAPEEVSRRTRAAVLAIALAVAAGLAILAFAVVTKRSERLITTALGFAAAALAAWLVGARATRARAVCACFAAAALGFVAWRCVTSYYAVGDLGVARREAIEHAAPGSTVRVERYPVPAGTWFRGEDLEIPSVRDLILREYHLGAIELTDSRR